MNLEWGGGICISVIIKIKGWLGYVNPASDSLPLPVLPLNMNDIYKDSGEIIIPSCFSPNYDEGC